MCNCIRELQVLKFASPFKAPFMSHFYNFNMKFRHQKY
jgi:hypothetical protein